MKNIIEKLKKRMQAADKEEEEYVTLQGSATERDERLFVRPFVLEDFSDLKPMLDYLREGSTIALVNIKPMREKDLLELKRAVSKIKKTVEAINGDIRGFGEDHLIIVPNYVDIAKHQDAKPAEELASKAYYE